MAKLWKNGEHVAIIGPTGEGKTTVGYQLMPLKSHEVIIATKPFDDTQELFAHRTYTTQERHWGRVRTVEHPVYTVIDEWPPPDNTDKVILWAKARTTHDDGYQYLVLDEALNGIYQSGHWCVFIDDCNELVGSLGLGKPVRKVMNMGRSAGVTAVVGANRPCRVPRECFAQVRYVLSYYIPDERDTDTVAEIAGLNKTRYRELNEQLQYYPHCFYCTHRRRTVMVGR
jgi:energy-coupling factor transporter ATP-binding protein EcfA2